jgi:flagellar biogenesis protein FliO
MSDFVLWTFIAVILANAYCMVRFCQAMRKFTRSQQLLNEMLKRAGWDKA